MISFIPFMCSFNSRLPKICTVGTSSKDLKKVSSSMPPGSVVLAKSKIILVFQTKISIIRFSFVKRLLTIDERKHLQELGGAFFLMDPNLFKDEAACIMH